MFPEFSTLTDTYFYIFWIILTFSDPSKTNKQTKNNTQLPLVHPSPGFKLWVSNRLILGEDVKLASKPKPIPASKTACES